MSMRASIASPTVITPLVRVTRQLMLVPEAVGLALLISLYAIQGRDVILAVLALFAALWFALRMGLLITARRALEDGHYARAEALANWAVSMYPCSADALTLRAAAQLADGQHGPAITHLQRALTYYPGHAGMYTTLATGLLAAGQAEAARTTALAALTYDPTYGPAYLPLTEAEMRLGASDASVEELLRQGLALSLPPGDRAALQCTLAMYVLRREENDEARTLLTAAEAFLADSPVVQRASLHFHLGELWRTIGDLEAARTHFAASAELDPEGPHAATAWRAART